MNIVVLVIAWMYCASKKKKLHFHKHKLSDRTIGARSHYIRQIKITMLGCMSIYNGDVHLM